MNKRQVVLGAALTALVAAGTTLKTSTAQANDDHAATTAAGAEKNSCKAKESCKGKKKHAVEDKEKHSCKAKDSCAAKAEDKK